MIKASHPLQSTRGQPSLNLNNFFSFQEYFLGTKQSKARYLRLKPVASLRKNLILLSLNRIQRKTLLNKVNQLNYLCVSLPLISTRSLNFKVQY